MFPTQEHINAARTAADRVKEKFGARIYPSVTLAQVLIESGGGKHLSGRFNLFGIKATSAQIAAGDYTECETGEVVNGRHVMIKAKFANFASLADAYEQHAMLFVRVKLYAPALKATSARQFVLEIAKYYASAEKDPNPKLRYSYKLIEAMDQLNLYRYDAPETRLASVTQPIQPPAHATATAKGGAAAGAVIAAAGAAAAQAHGSGAPLWIGLTLALAALGFAAWRYVQAHQEILAIPLRPPRPSPEAAALPAA